VGTPVSSSSLQNPDTATQRPAAAAQFEVPDSLKRAARLAVDSVLDAAMLDRIAAAHPPEGPVLPVPPSELESATIRSLFDIDVANFEDHGRVKYWVDFFSGPARERMGIWLVRMPRYEPEFRAALLARGLPGDLAYLPLIESGYSPTAVSRSRAVGMWQFMKATGKYYGLRVDAWVDERRDVRLATHAAVRYLGDLTARFGSPYLAAAAYNGGPGRIRRGLAKLDPSDDEEESADLADADGGSPQAGDIAFFQLADTRYIRQETKDYVPKLIAAAMIAKQPERYGFPPLVPVSGVGDLDSVVVSDATGLDVIAELAGISLADVRELNPVFLRPLTPPKRRAVVRLPKGLGANTHVALEALPAGRRLTDFPHHAKSGETITTIARKYGVTATALRAHNPEYRTRSPKRGNVVQIPGQARLAGWVAENRRVAISDGGGRTHRVARGETLGGISRRYRVSVAELRAWNNLNSKGVIRAGQRLRVGGPAAPGKTASAQTSNGGARVHIVKTGDTLSSLARRYKVTVQTLRTANDLPAGRPLLAGRRLTIPS
jgi:membrane-bound lytic murein transglycosylase D